MTPSGDTEAANSSDGWWDKGMNVHNATINQIKDAEEERNGWMSALMEHALRKFIGEVVHGTNFSI